MYQKKKMWESDAENVSEQECEEPNAENVSEEEGGGGGEEHNADLLPPEEDNADNDPHEDQVRDTFVSKNGKILRGSRNVETRRDTPDPQLTPFPMLMTWSPCFYSLSRHKSKE